jgi:hypothetical protein
MMDIDKSSCHDHPNIIVEEFLAVLPSALVASADCYLRGRDKQSQDEFKINLAGGIPIAHNKRFEI